MQGQRSWFRRERRFACPRHHFTPAYRRLGFEPLEDRTLLSVTLNNGLPVDHPRYLEHEVDKGGDLVGSTYNGLHPIFEYQAMLNVGGVVTYLGENGSDPELSGNRAVSDSFVQGLIGTINVRIESHIPPASNWLVNT